MEILYGILFTIGFFGIPMIIGHLAVGRDYLPEPILIQWLAGFVLTLLLGALLTLFLGGLFMVMGIIQSKL